MTRELLQKAYVALDGQWWAQNLCRQIDNALAAPQPEPVAHLWKFASGELVVWGGDPKDGGSRVFPVYAAPPAAPAPGDMVMVPLKFVQDFNTLAHNYCLRAVPPDYYSGTEADAFQHAYSRCGSDLRRLREILAAAPAPAVPDGSVRDKLIEALTRELGDTYDCTRVWEAWHFGNMSQEDFEPVLQRVDDIAESVLGALSAAPAVRESLTDEQFADIVAEASLEVDLAANPIKLLAFARAVLKAHGIGGGGNG